MNILRLAFELFVIYMLYKLIFGFIIPVYRTTRQMKKKMAEMHQRMQEQETAEDNRHSVKQERTTKAYSDDYIDYEEIK